MTYAETLDYLFTQLPMYQRQGAAAMKKDLTNIRALLAWLGDPHERLACIHVAGTNGKGTVCHLIAAALQRHGYRVGMYTSPHYRDFRERIKIDGAFIPERDVIDFTARLRDAGLGIDASFFEITVAMAFDYFAREMPDYCVIEVGLGGRLDSTNIITPIVSVITNIGWDHTDMLGGTLGEIAGEKAGIIKPGVPVVVGIRQAETEPVFGEFAERLDADLTYAEDHYEWQPERVDHQAEQERWTYQLQAVGRPTPLPIKPTGLVAAAVQRQNLVTALVALEELEIQGRFKVNYRELHEAWSRLPELTYYIGRFQTLSDAPGGPLCLADSAHNVDGLRPAMQWLTGFDRPLYIVLGMVSDKDHAKALALFPKAATYYFAKADIPRGLPADTLREKAAAQGLLGQAYGSVAEAYRVAREDALRAHGDGGLVFVGGSIFTVGEVL